jgi:DNA-binding transcriptional ArsR family regulator
MPLDTPSPGVPSGTNPMITGNACKEAVAKTSLHSYGRLVPADPTPLEPAVEVTDVRALRALAHPLRNRLLGRLRLHGPATASQLARAVGESSGSTSYHLRQLAAYGFVEEVEDQGTARERWWRARHRMTSWQAADVVAQEGGAEVEDEMTRLQLDQHARVLTAWRRQKEQLDPAWTAGASLNDYALRLRPEQARALLAQLDAVLNRWMDEHPADAGPEGGDLVSVLLDVVPLKEWPS